MVAIGNEIVYYDKPHNVKMQYLKMNNMQKYTKIMYIYKKIQINTLQDKKNCYNET